MPRATAGLGYELSGYSAATAAAADGGTPSVEEIMLW
jgi:hypothetical protein